MSLDNQTLPVLPLRDVVVYPHMVIPLFVGREKFHGRLAVVVQRDLLPEQWLVALSLLLCQALVARRLAGELCREGHHGPVQPCAKVPQVCVRPHVQGAAR